MAGMATMDGAPMRRDALIRISSTTKPVTATAMLSLIDEAHSTSTRRSMRDYPNTLDAVSCADPTAPM
jgi:Beta-lactamase